jgi:predicted ATPase
MVQELVGMFTDGTINSKNAQLLFSTHSHQILSQLDKYQIVLTEKNSDGQTETWRLDEMKGVRADDNYYTKYIAGAYGAVPNIG